jgi:peroxiredoxin
LGEAHDEIRAAGGDVVAIFQYRADPTFHFCRKRKVPFDCLGDPERAGYQAVGLERGPAREYIGPHLAKSFLRAARHGHITTGNPQGGDVAQRPGTFVVSPEGRVLYAHYHKDSADNPPVAEIVAALRAAQPSA